MNWVGIDGEIDIVICDANDKFKIVAFCEIKARYFDVFAGYL